MPNSSIDVEFIMKFIKYDFTKDKSNLNITHLLIDIKIIYIT